MGGDIFQGQDPGRCGEEVGFDPDSSPVADVWLLE
jgi:hypothetical protein